jgi:hypothetical protein
MHLLARVRFELARRPWIYWLIVAILAALVALGVARAEGRVDAARRSWGEQVTVWVATADIEPGEPISAEHRVVPRAVIPVRAVTDGVIGSVARQRIAAGAIITALDVTGAGPAGLVPAGWLAIVIPTPSSHFAAGDRVTVFAADRSLADGVVVDHTDSDVMVAVPATAAGDLAASVLAGSAVIALAP